MWSNDVLVYWHTYADQVDSLHRRSVMCDMLLSALQWCHKECNGISNHQHLDCLLNHLFRHRSKLQVTGLCEGIHQWPVDSPHKGPLMCKMFHANIILMLTDCKPVMSRWCSGYHGYGLSTSCMPSNEASLYTAASLVLLCIQCIWLNQPWPFP